MNMNVFNHIFQLLQVTQFYTAPMLIRSLMGAANVG